MKKAYKKPSMILLDVVYTNTLCATSSPSIIGGEPGTEGCHGNSQRNDYNFLEEEEDDYWQ